MAKTENFVEKQVVEFMRREGWTAYRQQSGLFKTEHGGRVRVGFEGEPDWRFERPVTRGVFQVCRVETKAPGKKPKPKQLEAIASFDVGLNQPAWWCDSIEMHKQKYYENFKEYGKAN